MRLGLTNASKPPPAPCSNQPARPPDELQKVRGSPGRGDHPQPLASGAVRYPHVDRKHLPADVMRQEDDERPSGCGQALEIPADVGDVLAHLPREDALKRYWRRRLAAGEDARSTAVPGDHSLQVVDLRGPGTSENTPVVG